MFRNVTTLQRGFTFIELMVTIAIIGVLAAVALTAGSRVRLNARDAKRISDINQMRISVEAFYNRCRSYPSAPLNLNDNAGGTCPSGVTLGSYLPVIPVPPSNLNNPDNYYYTAYTPPGYTYPVGYHFMVFLENSSNSALRDDSDFQSYQKQYWKSNQNTGGTYGTDPRYDLMYVAI